MRAPPPKWSARARGRAPAASRRPSRSCRRGRCRAAPAAPTIAEAFDASSERWPARRPRQAAAAAAARARRARPRRCRRRSAYVAGQPDGRDQHAAERRPGDGGEVAVDGLERGGGRELVLGHEPRASARAAPACRAPKSDVPSVSEHVERPDLRLRRAAAFTARSSATSASADLRREQQPPPVDRVGDRAADERERSSGTSVADAEQADLRASSRQLVDLVRDRDEA